MNNRSVHLQHRLNMIHVCLVTKMNNLKGFVLFQLLRFFFSLMVKYGTH